VEQRRKHRLRYDPRRGGAGAQQHARFQRFHHRPASAKISYRGDGG
jgi:hypothetical protein